jgi:hypothetical protein
VRILNVFGQQLWQKKINGTAQVNMKTWASGTYVVKINEGNSVSTYKVQKQ